jgi:putative Holliday junction resolvase
MAERALIEGDVSRSKRKGLVDQVAAVLILQSWLDAQPRAAEPEPTA